MKRLLTLARLLVNQTTAVQDEFVERVLTAFAGGPMEPFEVTMSDDGWALLQATRKM